MSRLRRVFFTISSVIFIIVLESCQVFAQKNITEREQTWVGYFQQLRFTQKSGLWVDVHFRMTDHYIQQRTMTVARAGYVHHFSEALRLMGGMLLQIVITNPACTGFRNTAPGSNCNGHNVRTGSFWFRLCGSNSVFGEMSSIGPRKTNTVSTGDSDTVWPSPFPWDEDRCNRRRHFC